MSFLSREEELNLIIDSLERERRELEKTVAPYEGKILSGDKAEARRTVNRRIATIDHTVNLYSVELRDIKWNDMVEGVTSKM